MFRPSRTRRIVKWTGAGLSLLGLTSWILSLTWRASVSPTGDVAVAIDSGEFVVVWSDLPAAVGANSPPGLHRHRFNENDMGLGWFSVLHFNIRDIQTWQVLSIAKIPLWPLLLITAIPTAWLWHRDRRRIRPGHCSRCGYDLTGNTSGVCSECGAKIDTGQRVAVQAPPGGA